MAGVTEQIQALLAQCGPGVAAAAIGLSTAAISVAVAVTRYVTTMPLQTKINQAEGQLKIQELKQQAEISHLQRELDAKEKSRAEGETKLNEQLKAQELSHQAKIDQLHRDFEAKEKAHANAATQLQERYDDLDRRHQDMLRVGALVSDTVKQIEADVADLASQVDATNYAVLVPAPTSIPGDTPDQLVFLCLSGPQAATLRWVRVPMGRSIAGEAYRSAKAVITQRPVDKEGFSHQTDQIANFKTEHLLTVPLLHRTRCVGVVQLVNKRGHRPFDPDDRERAEAWSTMLARRVAEFVEDPRKLAALGHAPRQNRVRAVVLFTDISSFAGLFNEQDASVVIDLTNQFFQELCSIGQQHGGVVDQFLGDGFMMTFNVVQNLDSPAQAALQSAKEMVESFRRLRDKWRKVGYAGTSAIFVRLGIELGPVTRAEIGHLQSRRMTVMGAAVNTAAHLCDAGPRGRDVVLIGDGMRAALPQITKLEPFTRKGLPDAYEVGLPDLAWE